MSNKIQFRRSTAILTLLAASIGGGVIAAFAVAIARKRRYMLWLRPIQIWPPEVTPAFEFVMQT